MKKVLGLLTIAALAVAFSVGAPKAHAATAADIQAMIAQLQAQLNALSGGTTVAATFNADLTIGSTGADVTALQNWLISKGFSIPAGATGYFGSQTQSAVAAFQIANNIAPSAGYFGPKTRAVVNAMAGGSITGGTTIPGCAAGAMYSSTTGASCAGAVVTVPGCTAGAMFSSTTGASCTGGTVTGGTSGTITTPGAEGILTVTAGPISNSVVNVGQTQVPVMTIRAQAQNSDIAVQRVQLDLGNNTNIYNKIYSKLYVVDASTGNILASTVLNSSTVVQSGSDYVVSLTGFSFVVPKGTYRDLQIKADLYGSINDSYIGTYTMTVQSNGVRGIDGAGQDQYGPAGTISQAITLNKSLIDNSIANISLDSATPQATAIPVTDTTNGQYLQLPVLTFDVGAQNDSVHLHNLAVNFTAVQSASVGSITAAYLYQGSTQISSAAITNVSGNNYTATFSNIQDGTAGASVPVNTTLPYTVKVDVTGVTAGSLTVTASTTQTGTTIYNSQDGTVQTMNGSAIGNALIVLGKGPAFTLNSSSIAVSGQNQNGSTVSTSTITATFSVSAQAVGTPVLFGTQASSTNPMFTFKVYNGAGTVVAANTLMASSSGFIVPTGTGFTSTGATSFQLAQQQSGTLNNITFSFAGKDSTGQPLTAGPYSVEISSISYVLGSTGAIASQNYMSGLAAWRTSGINP